MSRNPTPTNKDEIPMAISVESFDGTTQAPTNRDQTRSPSPELKKIFTSKKDLAIERARIEAQKVIDAEEEKSRIAKLNATQLEQKNNLLTQRKFYDLFNGGAKHKKDMRLEKEAEHRAKEAAQEKAKQGCGGCTIS